MLAYSNPLDQYLLRHPQELFRRVARARADRSRRTRICCARHLQCAAYRGAPDRAGRPVVRATPRAAIRTNSCDEGLLEERERRWFYPWEDYPAGRVNLRGTEGDPYPAAGHFAATMRCWRNWTPPRPCSASTRERYTCTRAESYLITDLDLKHRVALAQPTEVAYYTQPIEDNQVEIIRSTRSRADLAYRRLPGPGACDGTGPRLPPARAVHRSHPRGVRTGVACRSHLRRRRCGSASRRSARAAVLAQGLDLAGGLHAVEHAVIGMLPLFAMCDRNDIGGVSTLLHPDTGAAQVFVYDAYPGGVGIAEKGFEMIRELWERTLELVSECPCAEGCPSCIQSPKCGNNNEPLDKAAAVIILRHLVGRQSS